MQYGFRKNVCKYDDQGNKKAYPDGDLKDTKEIFLKLSGKMYCQCDRKWRIGLILPGKSRKEVGIIYKSV